MIQKAFSVFDSKAQAYAAPFFMHQNGEAVRVFTDLVNDPQTMVNRHAADYSLYEIGSFDTTTGEMVSITPHVLLGHGSEFKELKPIVYNPAASETVSVNSKEN